MDLRQWSADAFVQDTWRITPRTTLDFGLRYEFMAPLADMTRQLEQPAAAGRKPARRLSEGRTGCRAACCIPNKLRFAPRLGIAHHFDRAGLVLRAAYGIFYTPVDLNTWCNQLHNVPLVFPITQQSDNFTPGINGFNFPQPVLGQDCGQFHGVRPVCTAAVRSAVERSLQKSLGRDTTLEVGYHGERGFHLQRAHLINNALPGPGLDPAAPALPRGHVSGRDRVPGGGHGGQHDVSRQHGEHARELQRGAGMTRVISTYAGGTRAAQPARQLHLCQESERCAGFSVAYVRIGDSPEQQRPSRGEGPACDIRHRFALSPVYDIRP